jgi:hypothetical protein
MTQEKNVMAVPGLDPGIDPAILFLAIERFVEIISKMHFPNRGGSRKRWPGQARP